MTIARKTKFAVPGMREFGQLTNVIIDDGEMVAIDTAGYARPARVSTTDVIVGIAHIQGSVTRSDSTGIASGVKRILVRDDDIAFMENSASGDLIGNVDVGKDVYVVDSVTLGLTSGSSTRCVAGKLYWVNEAGKPGVKFNK